MTSITHRYSFPGKLTQTEYSDVFLTTADGGGRFVQAHRVVLAAVSDKLYSLCEKGGRVVVRNISYVVLERMVRLIYLGFVEVGSRDEVGDLMDGMDMLRVKINISESEMIASGEYFESTIEENVKQKDDAETHLFMEGINGTDDHNNLNRDSLPIVHDSIVTASASENILNVSFKKGSRYVINDRIKKVSVPTIIVHRKARPSRSPWVLRCPSPCSSLTVECSSDSSEDELSDSDDSVAVIVENPFFAPDNEIQKFQYQDIYEEATTSQVQKKPEPPKPSLVPLLEEITVNQIEKVSKVGVAKVYCKRTGTTCHQCRTKTTDTKTVCRSGKCVGMRGHFCGPCLERKYGEDAREALMLPDWKCPPCRNICSCSICRGRKRN